MGNQLKSLRISLAQYLSGNTPDFKGKQRFLLALLTRIGEINVPLNRLTLSLDLEDKFERTAVIGRCERDVLNVLRSRLRSGDVFCDCGGHVGIVSIALASEIDLAEIVAYEPSPPTFARLSHNFQINAGRTQSKLTAKMIALGNGDVDEVEIQVSAQHGWSTCSKTAATVGKNMGSAVVSTSKVEVKTLDEEFPCFIRPPDALKIDVEGWEQEVLDGASRLLGQFPPKVIVVENNPRILKATGRNFKDIVSRLSAFGYGLSAELPNDAVFEPLSE